MIVYLAEPIDFAGTGSRPDGDRVAQQLTTNGASVFRPALAWSSPARRAEHTDQMVIRRNREMLDASAALVAVLPSSVRSVGVPMEIAWAVDQGKPVVVLTDLEHSAMLNGHPLIVTVDNPDMVLWAFKEARNRAESWADADYHRVRSGLLPKPGPVRELRYKFTGDSGGWPVGGAHVGLHRAYGTDAGFDLFTTHDHEVFPGEFQFIPCGVSVELPPDVFGWVVARSSAMRDWGMFVLPGVIDPGYTGEMGVSVYRVPAWPWPERAGLSDESVNTIPAGTRLGQLVLLPNMARSFVETVSDQLAAGARGANGFGSTGNGTPHPRKEAV